LKSYFFILSLKSINGLDIFFLNKFEKAIAIKELNKNEIIKFLFIVFLIIFILSKYE